MPVLFLQFPLSTKHEPLSHKMTAGAPNMSILPESSYSVLMWASLNNTSLVIHLEASSRYVTRFRFFMRGFFIMSVCMSHGIQIQRLNLSHLRFFDLAGELTIRSLDLIVSYTRQRLVLCQPAMQAAWRA